MHAPRLRLGAAVAAATALLVTAAGSASAKTQFADLRVVTHTGRTLAEFRQYTGTTTIRSVKQGKDCFGSHSSGKRYRLHGANALGILKDALASDRALRPLVLSDAFVADFGLGVCSVGGFDTAGFSYWDLIRDDLAATTGAQFTPVRNGDDIIWYLTSGSESSSGPQELLLSAPPSATPGHEFTVNVVRFDGQGESHPAGGVAVSAGKKLLGTTGANGKLRVQLDSSAALNATGTTDDIPSNHADVCVTARKAECPAAHGRLIYGSAHRDRIDGTRGWDRIRARGGADFVDLRSGGRDRVNCGGGDDVVILDRGQRGDHTAKSCEHVRRR